MTLSPPPRRRLEGPGGEERLEQLREKFARISGRGSHPLAAIALMIYGAVIFVVVILGFSALTTAYGGFH
jgi:hypothetical protein